MQPWTRVLPIDLSMDCLTTSLCAFSPLCRHCLDMYRPSLRSNCMPTGLPCSFVHELSAKIQWHFSTSPSMPHASWTGSHSFAVNVRWDRPDHEGNPHDCKESVHSSRLLQPLRRHCAGMSWALTIGFSKSFCLNDDFTVLSLVILDHLFFVESLFPFRIPLFFIA